MDLFANYGGAGVVYCSDKIPSVISRVLLDLQEDVSHKWLVIRSSCESIGWSISNSDGLDRLILATSSGTVILDYELRSVTHDSLRQRLMKDLEARLLWPSSG
jgi:hypothetical protein